MFMRNQGCTCDLGLGQAQEEAGIQPWTLPWTSQWQLKALSSTPRAPDLLPLLHCVSPLLASGPKVTGQGSGCLSLHAYIPARMP